LFFVGFLCAFIEVRCSGFSRIVAEVFEITIAAAIDDEGLVAAAEEVAEEFVAAVEAARVGGKEPFHAVDEIGLGCLEDEMKMIVHEAIGMNLPGGLGASFAQGFEKEETVFFIVEDGLAAVATAHDVIDGSRILNA
jgi:hypothetical protein